MAMTLPAVTSPAADAARVFDGKVCPRQGKIGAADNMPDGLGFSGVVCFAGTEIGSAYHLPAMCARGVLAIEIIGKARAEYFARCGVKGIVEWLDFVADLIELVLVEGTLVWVRQEVVHALGGIERLRALICGHRHRIVGSVLGTLGVVLVWNRKQANLGKGAARLDDADRLAVSPRHVFV